MRGFLRDVVGEFVEAIADGEFGGDLGDGVAGGLAGERAGAADAGFISMTTWRPVPGWTPNWMLEPPVSTPMGADAGDGGVAHFLVFAVGQRHLRGDGDGVAGVDAHGVEVFDGADDDDVVGRGRA